jgi:excisionase family DNA binding protein
MDVSTLVALIEEAVAQGKVADVPALLGALERLKAMLWSRMVAASCGATSPQPPDAATLLTMPQVAKRLAIPEGRAYELARQGQLPTVKVGKYVRVPLAELETWVGQQTSLERRIDRAPPNFHSALARRKRPARTLTGARAQSGGARRKRNNRVSPTSQESLAGIRPPLTTPCFTAESGSVESDDTHDVE